MNKSKVVIEIKVDLAEMGSLVYRLIKQEDYFSMYISYVGPAGEESCLLEDVSRDFEEAANYAYLFAKETVTPDTAGIIMEELLSV